MKTSEGITKYKVVIPKGETHQIKGTCHCDRPFSFDFTSGKTRQGDWRWVCPCGRRHVVQILWHALDKDHEYTVGHDMDQHPST